MAILQCYIKTESFARGSFYIYNLQKQKGRLRIDVEITNEPCDSRCGINSVYRNQEGNKFINLKIVVKNNHNLPLDITFFFLGVPKLQWFDGPVWLLEKLSAINNIPLPNKHETETLSPGQKTDKLNISGFNIANILQNKGLSGNINVMVGVCDEKKNIYYSRPFQIEIQEWMRDKGNFIIGSFENWE